jgi:diamine N-acetyltransferase
VTTPALWIRTASPDDAETLTAFAAASFRDTYSPDDDADEVEKHISLNFTVPQIAELIADPGSSTLLAYVDQELVGYATLRKGPVPSCVREPSSIELLRSYVAEREIGKGHGSALLRACLEEAGQRGSRAIWLSVWEKNARACSFYEKWGFQRVGTHEFIFAGRAYDDLVMLRPIEDGPSARDAADRRWMGELQRRGD